MTVTTGGRGFNFLSSSSVYSNFFGIELNVETVSSTTSGFSSLTSNLSSPAISATVSKSMDCVIFAITPFAMSFLIISIGVSLSIVAKSRTVSVEGSVATGGGAGFGGTMGAAGFGAAGRAPGVVDGVGRIPGVGRAPVIDLAFCDCGLPATFAGRWPFAGRCGGRAPDGALLAGRVPFGRGATGFDEEGDVGREVTGRVAFGLVLAGRAVFWLVFTGRAGVGLTELLGRVLLVRDVLEEVGATGLDDVAEPVGFERAGASVVFFLGASAFTSGFAGTCSLFSSAILSSLPIARCPQVSYARKISLAVPRCGQTTCTPTYATLTVRGIRRKNMEFRIRGGLDAPTHEE